MLLKGNVLQLLFTLYSIVVCYPPKTKSKFCVRLGSITLLRIISTKTAWMHKTYMSATIPIKVGAHEGTGRRFLLPELVSASNLLHGAHEGTSLRDKSPVVFTRALLSQGHSDFLFDSLMVCVCCPKDLFHEQNTNRMKKSLRLAPRIQTSLKT